MSNNQNNGDNIKKITEAYNKGKGVLSMMDANYLQWIRLTANNHQLLELRNELRAHRENVPIQEENVRQHETLQREAELLLRMVGYLIHSNPQLVPESGEDVEKLRIGSQQAEQAIPDTSDVIAMVRMGGKELNSIVGLRTHIATSDDGNEWIIQMTRG